MAALGCEDSSGHGWRVEQGSNADVERISITSPPYLLNEVVADGEYSGTNLPLTQARSMILDAAGALMGIGWLTTCEDEQTRAASIGPLARACAERAATAYWVISGEGRDERLIRSLLVEFDGIDRLERLFPQTRTNGFIGDVEDMKAQLLRIAHANFDLSLDARLSIAGQTLPSLTKRVCSASTRYGYAELNAYTHPTGHRYATAAEWSVAAFAQLEFLPRSTLHNEGRLCEVAILCFARALETVSRYLDAPGLPQVREWVTQVVRIWNRWCNQNGCE